MCRFFSLKNSYLGRISTHGFCYIYSMMSNSRMFINSWKLPKPERISNNSFRVIIRNRKKRYCSKFLRTIQKIQKVILSEIKSWTNNFNCIKTFDQIKLHILKKYIHTKTLFFCYFLLMKMGVPLKNLIIRAHAAWAMLFLNCTGNFLTYLCIKQQRVNYITYFLTLRPVIHDMGAKSRVS